MKKILAFIMLSFFAFIACDNDDESNKDCNQIDACFLPPEPSDCLAVIPKYFYNQETEQCEQFIWGGCGDYPFDTIEECEVCLCND